MGKSSKTISPSDFRNDYYFNDGSKSYGESFQNFDWPSAEIVLTLFLTSDEFQNYISEKLKPHHISLSAFNLLNILRRKEESGCYLNELSSLLLVSRPNITGLIDTLVKQNRVIRVSEKEDRRKCKVQLTAEGRKFLDDFLPDHFQNLKKLTSPFSEEEKKTLVEFLERLRKQLKEA